MTEMKYEIEFKPRSLKDCKNIPRPELERIFVKIENMADDLKGNVKRLTNYSPEYRLRVGDYRILFETEKDKIIIYRIRHRKDAYK
jgi:mRNA interferase RelE/StbE